MFLIIRKMNLRLLTAFCFQIPVDSLAYFCFKVMVRSFDRKFDQEVV
jgi:hypothetical protein